MSPIAADEAPLKALYQDCCYIYETARREVIITRSNGTKQKYAANRFKQQMERAYSEGTLVSAVSSTVERHTQGFGHLAAAGRDDLMLESFVLDESKSYHQLFSPRTVQASRDRMAEYYRQLPDQPRPDDIEQEFGRAMRSVYTRAKSEASYSATYFLQMLDDVGPIEAARRLVMSTKPSKGFTALWERGRLDLTVEANVVKARFAPLFTEQERDAARSRLASYDYVLTPE